MDEEMVWKAQNKNHWCLFLIWAARKYLYLQNNALLLGYVKDIGLAWRADFSARWCSFQLRYWCEMIFVYKTLAALDWDEKLNSTACKVARLLFILYGKLCEPLCHSCSDTISILHKWNIEQETTTVSTPPPKNVNSVISKIYHAKMVNSGHINYTTYKQSFLIPSI